MAVWQFEDLIPEISKSTYVAESAQIIGNVKIGENCYIGPSSVVRGDYGSIEIGSNTSIQEGVVVHARPNEETLIGDWVTIAHGAILHTCIVDNYATVGMGAIASDYSRMETWSVLGEAALLKRGQRLYRGDIAVGAPARVIGLLDERKDIRDELMSYKEKYVEMTARYKVAGALKRIS